MNYKEERLLRSVRMIIEATELFALALDEWPDGEGSFKLQKMLNDLNVCHSKIYTALRICDAWQVEEFREEEDE